MRNSGNTATLCGLSWLLSLFLLFLWIAAGVGIGWDYEVHEKAMDTLRHGGNPYLAGIAEQDAFQKDLVRQSKEHRPYIYVYTPITLPLLHLLSFAPRMAAAGGYCLLYVLGVLIQLWMTARLAEESERSLILCFLPWVIHFPGLLFFCIVQSGNISYMLYALVLAACWRGWRRDRWLAFYFAVLIASCCKPPYLTLLAIAPLSTRRQWIPSGIAAFCGFALYGAQSLLWPEQYRTYLLAMQRVFTFNRDFGCSPAGRLAALLNAHGSPYALAGIIVYLLQTMLLLSALLWFFRAYEQGRIQRAQWLPVMLLGVLLLNPRVNEYDIVSFTIPMVLVCCRIFQEYGMHPVRSFLFFWLGVSVLAFSLLRHSFKGLECLLLMAIMIAGFLLLWRQSRTGNITSVSAA